MDPAAATCRQAPASRPPAVPLVERPLWAADTQPPLPFLLLPDAVIREEQPVEPELRQLAASLMAALVEVLSGQRSAEQLERWVEPELLSLVEHLRRASRAEGLKLRSIRVQSPHSEAVEVSAHLLHGDASRAAALRISRRRGRWVGTHLAIALRPDVVHQAGWINPVT